jgi:hypothetical protein
MIIDLTEKARARRNAALKHVEARKSRLVSYADFRMAAREKELSAAPGFVSSRTLVLTAAA